MHKLHKSIYAFGNLELNYLNSNWNSSARRWVFPHFDGFVGWSFDPEQWWSAIESLMTTHCFVKRKMFFSCLRVRLIWVWRDLLECPRVCASSLNEADKERCGKNSPSMRLISGPVPVPVPNTILICLIAYYRYIWVAPACPVPLLMPCKFAQWTVTGKLISPTKSSPCDEFSVLCCVYHGAYLNASSVCRNTDEACHIRVDDGFRDSRA